MNLPELTGTPKEVTKATEFRRKAIDRMPGILHLLDMPELTTAEWWNKNKARLGHVKVFIDLMPDIESKNELRATIYELPQELREQRAREMAAKMEEINKKNAEYMAFYQNRTDETDPYFDEGSYMDNVAKGF